MKGTYKLILTAFFSAILFFIFNMLEFALLNEGSSKNIQSVVFSICAGIVVFYPKYKSKLINGSLVLLLIMVIFYLFGSIKPANSIGSLGFGILAITIMSYIPTIFKKGYIEKL